MSQCVYCKKVLSSKSSLLTHQKQTKYCIEIQKSLNVQINVVEFNCLYCFKKFNCKDVKNKHEFICKSKKKDDEKNNDDKIKEYEIKMIDYESKLKTLENVNIILRSDNAVLQSKCDIFEKLHTKSDNCIEKIALQPKIIKSNSNSTTVNNLNNMPNFNITLENLTKAAEEKYSQAMFLQGQAGAAKFIVDYAKTLNNGSVPWAFTDKTRNILNYKDDAGEIVKDPKASMLTTLVADAIRTRNNEHYENIYKQNVKVYNSGDDDMEYKSDCDDTPGDMMEHRADECLMALKQLKVDNSVFRKILIKGS